MEEKFRLMYSSYKEEEIDKVAEVFDKYGVEYERSQHLTARKHNRYVLDSQATREETDAIRADVEEIKKRRWNWGKIGYIPTNESGRYNQW